MGYSGFRLLGAERRMKAWAFITHPYRELCAVSLLGPSGDLVYTQVDNCRFFLMSAGHARVRGTMDPNLNRKHPKPSTHSPTTTTLSVLATPPDPSGEVPCWGSAFGATWNLQICRLIASFYHVIWFWASILPTVGV